MGGYKKRIRINKKNKKETFRYKVNIKRMIVLGILKHLVSLDT